MNLTKIRLAKHEAERLVDRICELEDHIIESDQSVGMIFMGCKQTAAVKRASMDLTRVLSDLRR